MFFHDSIYDNLNNKKFKSVFCFLIKKTIIHIYIQKLKVDSVRGLSFKSNNNRLVYDCFDIYFIIYLQFAFVVARLYKFE